MTVMCYPQLSKALTLSYRTLLLSPSTGALCVKFSRTNTVKQSSIDHLRYTVPLSQARVNYQHLVFPTLLDTPIKASINNIVRIVPIVEVHTNKSLVAIISYEDLTRAFTCTKIILGIGTEGEWSVCRSRLICRSRVLLTPNMESSWAAIIILFTAPRMVHHVYKDNLPLRALNINIVVWIREVGPITIPCLVTIIGYS